MERRLLSQAGIHSSGFAYAEEWLFDGRKMERSRILKSYPWSYRWLDVIMDNGMGTPLTVEEIARFKSARVVRVKGNADPAFPFAGTGCSNR